jgi:DNA anti-recombination protein RmuC
MMNNRLAVLGLVDAYVGKYYSVEWVRKNILHQSDEDIREIDAQMSVEGEAQAAAEEEQAKQIQNTANTDPQKNKSEPQKLEIKVKQEPATSRKTTKEEVAPFVPKPLTEEDKKLIENMTRAIEKVSKEDLDGLEEIKEYD